MTTPTPLPDDDKNKRPPLPDYPEVTLEQLFLFMQIMESGSQIDVANRYQKMTPTKVSRAIKDLKLKFNLGSIPDREFWDSTEAQSLKKSIKPLLDAWEKFSANDHSKTVSIGSGGSILGWWIGKKSEEIRGICNVELGHPFDSINHVRLACQSPTNRDIFSKVSSGILDFGIVRASLLDHARAANPDTGTIESCILGKVRYGIAVPDKIKKSWGKGGTNWKTENGYLKEELTILNTGFFASVGPEGEFKERLNRAIIDSGINIRIEFSYRSFPQIIPHLLEGTHFGLCPILSDWKSVIPNTEIYPLRILSKYDRDIAIIWNKKLLKPWINMNEITKHLKWPDSGVQAGHPSICG